MKERVPAIEVMKRIMKSQLETGTPYMFYRDEANRMNPNKHAGMIYSSNLCTEIMQNMSPTTVTKEYTQDGEIIIHKNRVILLSATYLVFILLARFKTVCSNGSFRFKCAC